jgi:hypothetical protein
VRVWVVNVAGQSLYIFKNKNLLEQVLWFTKQEDDQTIFLKKK